LPAKAGVHIRTPAFVLAVRPQITSATKTMPLKEGREEEIWVKNQLRYY
jgi:hypothetical protein